MFDVGFWEILLILVLALVVLGPERLPQAARTVGYWVGKARRYIEGVKSEVEKEFDGGELKRMLHNQEVQIKELQSKLTSSEDYVNKSYHNMFEDKDDPGTEKSATEEDHLPEPRYEILEDDDDDRVDSVVISKRHGTEKEQSSTSDAEQASSDSTAGTEKPRSEKPE
ncbi:MAG: Sec-independent protein translocase protein TatB [Gammaproteobacteria bacterium]|nr:Sec-independent protein translocase protein TatB [Gammaproteobacteria bacterium]